MTRRFWTPAEIDVLRARYASEPTAAIALDLRRTASATYQMALSMGLRKSSQYLTLEQSGRISKMNCRGASTRFKKGFPPWNKGIPFKSGGRSAETQFKTGKMPHNHKPVGHERISKDGYLERKIAEPKTFKAVHVMVWEQEHGPVPKGHAVTFRQGRKTAIGDQITIDALELVSRSDLMRRNSYHNRYPKEICQAIQLRGALMRQIKKREKHAKQDH